MDGAHDHSPSWFTCTYSASKSESPSPSQSVAVLVMAYGANLMPKFPVCISLCLVLINDSNSGVFTDLCLLSYLIFPFIFGQLQLQLLHRHCNVAGTRHLNIHDYLRNYRYLPILHDVGTKSTSRININNTHPQSRLAPFFLLTSFTALLSSAPPLHHRFPPIQLCQLLGLRIESSLLW